MADILGALVARDLKDRLALLSTTDVTRRLELARDLMAKLLAAAQRAARGGADARALVPAGAGRGRARAGGRGRGGVGFLGRGEGGAPPQQAQRVRCWQMGKKLHFCGRPP